MRYFAEIAFNGTSYSGWQKQPNAVSVQTVIEQSFSTILRHPTDVVGCGRTDAGVHASQYFLHFDSENSLPENFVYKINSLLPNAIFLKKVWLVDDNAHARFDAFSRSYIYNISLQKNPFTPETEWYFSQGNVLDTALLQQAAELLLPYKSFFPFCKSDHDAQTLVCHLTSSFWKIDNANARLQYHITSNRFLRGMVRLIVGMCLNVSLKKLSLHEVESALINQTQLHKSWSVPPTGLFLSNVTYPYTD
ncbi:MAG: tRNA pseudouridine(38-40) synthase TruA [Saprospiraceae bacterium]|nr:tRNA pseudouridine(38-40) synthase TruA [Saprospiraceae bacterium]